MNHSHGKNRQPRFRSSRSMRGVGLVEVLIAVLVMAVGVLGIAAMQATTLRNSQSSVERAQAVMQTYTILDAMRANVDVARQGGYNLPMTCTASASGTLVANDQRFWLQTMQANLGPSACGKVTCVANACTVTVRWDDSRGKAGSSLQTLDTSTRI